jgi:hypothetical protein
MTQTTIKATAAATRSTHRVTKKAIALCRRVTG